MPRTIEELRAAIAAPETQDRAAALSELEALLSNSNTQDTPRAQLDKLRENRAALVGEFEQVTTDAVDDQGNARDFTPEEAEKRGALTARLDQLDAQITEREDAIRKDEENVRKKEMQDAIAEVRRYLGLGEQPANSVGGGIVVGNEPRTYERGNGQSYLLDMCLARTALGQGLGVRSMRAAERLARHARENHVEALAVDERIGRLDEEKRTKEFRTAEGYFLRQMIETHNQRDMGRGPIAERALSYRALSTAATAGGEFVPPMFLTAEWIAYARPGRVLADLQHHEDLPDGTMSISIPKVTGGTSSGTQGAQNTNVSMTDLQTAFVTFPVVTKAGQQVVSLQLLERSPISFDEVVGRDLALAYAQDLNTSIHSGLGGGDITGILNTSGINVVTWTQASPTVKGYYGQVAQAKIDIATGRKLPATHHVLTTGNWEWIGQTFDTNGRPLVVPEYNGPFNVLQVAPDAATAEGIVGRKLSGLDTYEDLTLPTNLGVGTNQDVAIIGRFDENYLYESPITTRMLPQTYGAQLSMLLQLYGYNAFTAARYPVANSVITGTGMSSANRTLNS
jgi:HK97 family phage major capsid protein